MAFTLAIVGRPNVGKSTLFNRLSGKKLALVDDQPGVTRDWRVGEAQLLDLEFQVIDTAGLDTQSAKGDALATAIQRQTREAMKRADAFLFVYDARAGVMALDLDVAAQLRRTSKPVLVAANKVEGRVAMPGVHEGMRLGFGEPMSLSAEHGLGLDELYDALKPLIEAAQPNDDASTADDPNADELDAAAKPVQIAVIGRPNAGKSTLVNRLLGDVRLVTSEVAGTTRDAIAVDLEWQGRAVRMIDTAGLRRKARVQEKLEKLSVADALRAIRFAEVVILVLDAGQPFETQDLQIADLVEREGRALLIALNKWDLVEDRASVLRQLKKRAEELLPQWRGVPIIALSALTGDDVDRLMPAVFAQYALWNKRIGTAPLNAWLAAALERHAPPAAKGRRIKIRYATQVKARPPTFALFVSQPTELPEDYERYLVNSLREAFGFDGVPIRLHLRAGKNPYADKS